MDVPSPPASVLSKKAAQWAAFLCYVLLVIGLFLKPESSFLGLGLCKNLNALDDEDDSQNDKTDGPNHLEPVAPCSGLVCNQTGDELNLCDDGHDQSCRLRQA